MKTRHLIAVLLLMTIASWLYAEIQPHIVQLTAANDKYTVPSNKIFLVEMGHLGRGIPTKSLAVSNASVLLAINIEGWHLKPTPIQPPLKIGGNWTLWAPYLGVTIETNEAVVSTNYQDVALFGLLIDPEDLYAGIPNQFIGTAMAQDWSSVLALQSARPPIIKIEQSPDLVNWEQAMEAVLSRTANSLEREVVLPAPGADMDFIRAKARSRKATGGL